MMDPPTSNAWKAKNRAIRGTMAVNSCKIANETARDGSGRPDLVEMASR